MAAAVVLGTQTATAVALSTSIRHRFAGILVNLDNQDIADTIREPARNGAAIGKRIGSGWASRRRMKT